MKKFKYGFTRLLKIFICIGIVLAVAGIGLNIYFIFSKGLQHAERVIFPILQYTLTFFVSIMLLVILISLLASSYYSIEGKTLTTSFGIIKSKYDISEIQTVILDRNTNKLSVFFGESSYIIIAINPDWYDDFTDALLEANPKIEFSINSETPKDKDDKNKKA